MEKKWNLQDIKPAEKRRAPARTIRRVEPEEESVEREPRPRAAGGGKRSRKGLLMGILAVTSVLIVGVGVAALTGGATVTVHLKFREPTINSIVESKQQAADGELAFEVMTLEAEGEREVTATGQEDVEEQATGRITIYKTTAGSERLIKNTRFEGPDGLIFRVTESVEVPGATTDAGGNTSPGSTSAEVFADQPGSQYNLPAGTKFTVPGFKENDLTELYNSIYAENQSSFSGGHVGPRFIIDESELTAATDSLRAELTEALRGRVTNERPAGFVLFDSGVTFSYQAMPSEDLGNGRVKIKEKTILHAPMFKNEDLAAYIARATVPGYEGESIRLEDPSALTFEYATPYDPAVPEAISFKLLGKPRLVWTYDAEKLKTDLAGGNQTSLNTVLGGYPAIEKATAKIRPFWRRAFPDNPAEIVIKEVVGEVSE